MNLTIQTLFTDPAIVKAIIDRVLQMRLDTIYWKQYGDFLETKTRVFKTYLGTVTGVVAGSILGKNDQKPIRERRSLGSGYTEIAYLGDRYQMDIERLSPVTRHYRQVQCCQHGRPTYNFAGDYRLHC